VSINDHKIMSRWPFLQTRFWKLVVWLVAIDLTFMAVNIVAVILHEAKLIAEVPELIRVAADWALPEIFGYLKWLVIIAALLWMTFRDMALTPLLWAAVFLLIFLDDAFQFHENVGEWLSSTYAFNDHIELSGNDIGEFEYFLAAGAVVLILVALVVRNRGTAAYLMSKRYVFVLGGLAFFGVGVDALHQMIAHLTSGLPVWSMLKPAFALIEDGGEMIVGSVALALTLTIQMQRADPEKPEV
jgi:hypothetical protein